MLKRIMGAGINMVVLAVSIGVFLLAFFLLNMMGASQRPPTIKVLSATRDLSIGEVITTDTLAEKTVFQDDNASLYIPAEEADGVVRCGVGPELLGPEVLEVVLVA